MGLSRFTGCVLTGLILSQWVTVSIGASEIKCNTMGLFDGAMVHEVRCDKVTGNRHECLGIRRKK